MKTTEKVLLSKEHENLFKHNREHSFPREGILLWNSLFEFCLNIEFKTAPLSKVYQAFVLVKEIFPQLINNKKLNHWDNSPTSIQRDIIRNINILRWEVILRIKEDYSENNDFEIPEMYFRFKFLNRSEPESGPGTFPDVWEGRLEVVSRLKNKLLEKLVSMIESDRRTSKNAKQVWYQKLMEFYNHSSETYNSLKEKITLKSLDIHTSINEYNLLQNKKPFTHNVRNL